MADRISAQNLFLELLGAFDDFGGSVQIFDELFERGVEPLAKRVTGVVADLLQCALDPVNDFSQDLFIDRAWNPPRRFRFDPLPDEILVLCYRARR